MTVVVAAWTAEAGLAYGSNPAAYGTRNGHGVLNFDDSTDEAVVFQGIARADLGVGDLTLKIYWAAASATSGSVKWDVQFEEIDPDVLDVDADSFATAQTVTDTAPGTTGFVTAASVAFTVAQADSLTAGSPFRVLVTRDTAVASDIVGDVQILRVTVEQ